jgi:hypothetical protein
VVKRRIRVHGDLEVYQPCEIMQSGGSEGCGTYFTGQAEKPVWLEFAIKCGYLTSESGRELYKTYDHVIGKTVTTIHRPEQWIISQ